MPTEHRESPETELTEPGDSSERCLSPTCRKLMEPKRKHAPVKFYCSEKCKMDAWAVKRVVRLYGLTADELHGLLFSRR